MGFQDIIALAIVAVACYYVAKSVKKQMSGGGCGCESSCTTEQAVERTRIKKTPLVTLETTPKSSSDSDPNPDTTPRD